MLRGDEQVGGRGGTKTVSISPCPVSACPHLQEQM
uniref:Uncharacterized protein n=1 Tax=Anguilla anguilla TaxID=7936 RepID=A0A0E9S6N1_ANGAN